MCFLIQQNIKLKLLKAEQICHHNNPLMYYTLEDNYHVSVNNRIIFHTIMTTLIYSRVKNNLIFTEKSINILIVYLHKLF